MNITDKAEVKTLLYEMQYQFPGGISTFSACENHCGEGARGGRMCPDCITKELGKLVGDDLARRHLVALKVYKSLHNQIIDKTSK